MVIVINGLTFLFRLSDLHALLPFIVAKLCANHHHSHAQSMRVIIQDGSHPKCSKNCLIAECAAVSKQTSTREAAGMTAMHSLQCHSHVIL